jgi:hypothetical protein
MLNCFEGIQPTCKRYLFVRQETLPERNQSNEEVSDNK